MSSTEKQPAPGISKQVTKQKEYLIKTRGKHDNQHCELTKVFVKRQK